MLGTDQYAYRSQIRMVQPTTKLLLTLGVLAVTIVLNRWQVSLFVFAAMSVMNVRLGGHRWSALGHLYRVPMGFILLAVLTIVLEHVPERSMLLAGIPLFGGYVGISAARIWRGFSVIVKSFGIIAPMYFLVMNTAMTDVSAAMRALHVPPLLTELMELVYRFIFVLWDTARRIHVAQSARLGYVNYRASMRSTGDLAARLFFDAMRRADRVYNALESRGYNGVIATAEQEYESGDRLIGAGIVLVGIELVLFVAVRRLYG